MVMIDQTVRFSASMALMKRKPSIAVMNPKKMNAQMKRMRNSVGVVDGLMVF
jgi:hypothetical protein